MITAVSDDVHGPEQKLTKDSKLLEKFFKLLHLWRSSLRFRGMKANSKIQDEEIKVSLTSEKLRL